MIPTLKFIDEKVDYFNRMCFRGELPEIPVILTKAVTFLGKVTFTRMNGFFL